MESDTTPRPILSIQATGQVCWTTVTNLQYQLQWAEFANSTNWTNLGPVVVATGAIVCTPHVATSEQQRYYRVQVLP